MAENEGPIPYLDVINTGLGQVLTGLPLLFAAYKLLHTMLKTADPGLTFEQYNARLSSAGVDVEMYSQNWFGAHGYSKQPDGSWTKTAAPQTVASPALPPVG